MPQPQVRSKVTFDKVKNQSTLHCGYCGQTHTVPGDITNNQGAIMNAACRLREKCRHRAVWHCWPGMNPGYTAA